MKKTFNLILVIALLAFSLPSRAQDDDKFDKKERKRYEFFKERSISKSYPASGNTLDITNSFGEVKVITWDKNEIKVDIHIEASSTNKEQMERTFGRIDVKDNQSGNKITFKTEMENNDKHDDGCRNCSNTMAIDYEIHMPANNTLSIENSFGGIILPDYNGTVSLSSKFGSLTTGKLQKTEELNVEFGRANIASTGNIDATFKFSKINIDQLNGANTIKIEFCNFSKISLGTGLTSLKLNESYSTVNLRPGSVSAKYDISTSFGSVEDRANVGLKRTDTPDRYGPDSDKHYEGGSGSVNINARSSFGKIIIGEATAEDMKENTKSKSKGKVKEI